MRFDSVPVIYKKEMLDMLRDRRTLLSMIVVPIVSIPLLFFVMNHFVTSAGKTAEEEALTVGVQQAGRLPGLLNALSGAGFRVTEAPDLKAAVERKQIAAGVEPVPGPGGVPQVRIYADLSRQISQIAATRIRSALDAFKETSVRLKLIRLGLPESAMEPFTVERVNLAPPAKMAASLWGNILGYMVVIFMFSGAMYPAIDMTAGEKERRTLEVLLSAPAHRDEMILGKLLAGTSAVVLTALLSIVSLVLSFRLLNFGHDAAKGFGGHMAFDLQHAALVMLALLPLAVLAASLMIAVALFAKSFKEAQTYLTPLVMLSVFPMMAGIVPAQFTPPLALIPLYNTSQSIKEILLGEINFAAFATMMLANIAYACLAFAAAVRIFRDERVLFRT